MPDQSSASGEHAIMREITAPLSDLPDDPVASVASQEFPVVLRGYDRVAVDAYVKHVSQIVAELYASRSPEGAVRRALERIGEQVSEILKRAHDTAGDLTAQSRSEAEDRLTRAREEADQLIRAAHQEAEQITRDAEQRARDLDSEVENIWAERDRIVEDVRKLSEDLGALASTAATRFPAAPAEDEPATATPGPPLAAEPEIAEQPTLVDQPPAPDQPTIVNEPIVVAEPEMTAEDVASPRVIDLVHVGRERVIGCWQVGDVLIDPGPASCLPRLLEALGDEQPAAVLLTHIHLDHAGATGSLVRLWPDLEVYVHERGAPHLIDPTRLLDSARRLYGDEMDRLWGEVIPVPEANLRLLQGGEQLLDCFEVAYTPGHAAHHVSYLYDDGTAFVGDAAGVRITPETLTVPPTPPPEVDLEAWHASIARLARWSPERLAITHFGSSDDVEDQLAELSERLDTWAALARTEDRDTFVNVVVEEISRDAGPELLPAYTQAAPPGQLYAGLERYWSKQASGDPPAPASTHAGRSPRPGSSIS